MRCAQLQLPVPSPAPQLLQNCSRPQQCCGEAFAHSRLVQTWIGHTAAPDLWNFQPTSLNLDVLIMNREGDAVPNPLEDQNRILSAKCLAKFSSQSLSNVLSDVSWAKSVPGKSVGYFLN